MCIWRKRLAFWVGKRSDFQTVQNPGDPEGENDYPMETAPGQPVQARGDAGLKGPHDWRPFFFGYRPGLFHLSLLPH